MPAAKRDRQFQVELADRDGGGRRSRRFRITVPATAKVTYGHLHPGTKAGYNDNAPGSAVLRIYEGTSQTAMFWNVISFRDLAYPMEVERREAKVRSNAVEVDGLLVKEEESTEVESEWGEF